MYETCLRTDLVGGGDPLAINHLVAMLSCDRLINDANERFPKRSRPLAWPIQV